MDDSLEHHIECVLEMQSVTGNDLSTCVAILCFIFFVDSQVQVGNGR